MNLGRKLLWAQAPLGLAVALLGALAAWSLASLGDKADLILRENYRSVLAAQRMKEAIERLDSAALFLVAGEEARGQSQFTDNLPRFEAELRAAEGNITEPGEAEALSLLRGAWEDYQPRWGGLARLPPNERARHYFAAVEPVFLRIKLAADDILALNQAAMGTKSAGAQRAARELRTGAISTALLALLAGALASSWLTARLLRPLGVLRQVARRVQSGDLDVSADERGGDELADLARDFNQMAESLRRYRRSTQGELDRAQRAAQAAIESLPDPVLVFAPSGEVTLQNQAAAALSGALAAQALGGKLQELFGRITGHVLGGRGAYTPKGYEEALRAPSAEGERFFLPRATPLYDREGEVTGATVLLQDITRLRRVDELKDDLVSTVAHEFRTPLTSLHMAVHLCAEEAAGPLTASQQDLLFAAREDCERLRALVDEILDLARIQSGRLSVTTAPTPAAALLEASADAARGPCEEAGLSLRVVAPPGLGEVLADAERVKLVFSNLLSNARKHSPPGGSITLQAAPEEDGVRFEVYDEGPGIPQEQQAALFDKFYQAPGARSGVGLGLYLVKELIQAHQGRYGVESEPGRGSRFWFTLPRA